MCTLVILRRPGTPWPVLLAANRDEMTGRPWRGPARHWDERPHVVGGFDDVAGGSWLGLNDTGVVAAILNRKGTLGPEEGKRSRGELVLEALDHADAIEAARALVHLNPSAYRPFNLVVGDNRDMIWLRHAGDGAIEARVVPSGLSMLAEWDLDDPDSARIRTFRPLFAAARPPDPDAEDWGDWPRLLAVRGNGTDDAMTIALPNGFATVSSSLIALPSAERTGVQPVWSFCPGPPDAAPWRPVPLD